MDAEGELGSVGDGVDEELILLVVDAGGAVAEFGEDVGGELVTEGEFGGPAEFAPDGKAADVGFSIGVESWVKVVATAQTDIGIPPIIVSGNGLIEGGVELLGDLGGFGGDGSFDFADGRGEEGDLIGGEWGDGEGGIGGGEGGESGGEFGSQCLASGGGEGFGGGGDLGVIGLEGEALVIIGVADATGEVEVAAFAFGESPSGAEFAHGLGDLEIDFFEEAGLADAVGQAEVKKFSDDAEASVVGLGAEIGDHIDFGDDLIGGNVDIGNGVPEADISSDPRDPAWGG